MKTEFQTNVQMKIGLFILLIVTVVPMALGQTNKFKNQASDFEFTYPYDWTIDTSTNNPLVLAPKEGTPLRHPATFQVLSEHTQENIEECFKTHVLNWYPDQFEDFKIKEKGDVEINGHQFKWIECQYKKVEGLHAVIIYLTVEKNRVYLIEGSTSDKNLSRFKSKFIEMINSFRLG